MLRLIARRLADGRPISQAIWRLNVGIETLIPTIGILIVADSGMWPSPANSPEVGSMPIQPAPGM